MIKSGLAFHVHHNILIEFCYDYDERDKVIKRDKPRSERKLRLRLFQLIPLNRLPKKGLRAYLKAWENCIKARETYYKTIEAYNKAWEALDKAGETYYKAIEAYNKAREALDKAGEIYLKVNKQALEKLHTELCPDCPWDGETIFSKEE